MSATRHRSAVPDPAAPAARMPCDHAAHATSSRRRADGKDSPCLVRATPCLSSGCIATIHQPDAASPRRSRRGGQCRGSRAGREGVDEPTRRRARARRPRAAARVPDARLRAAQAAQRRARLVPGLLLRLALPLPQGAGRATGWIVEAGTRRPGAAAAPASGPGSSTSSPPRARSTSRLLAEPARPPGRTSNFGVHFAFFAPHRRRDPAADPRGPAHPARGAPRRRPRRRSPAPASAWTATPSSCSGTGWSRSSARSAGSTS